MSLQCPSLPWTIRSTQRMCTEQINTGVWYFPMKEKYPDKARLQLSQASFTAESSLSKCQANVAECLGSPLHQKVGDERAHSARTSPGLPMARAFIATLSSQPIGMELCPVSLIDYQDPQKTNRTALYLPEVRPFSLLCAQPHAHAQSEQSPEWDCLLRLPPPLFPSTNQVGSRRCNQVHIYPAHAHSGM